MMRVDVPDDIILSDGTFEIGIDSGQHSKSGDGLSELAVRQIIRESSMKNRSDFGSYYVPNQLFALTESKQIKWQRLLSEYLTEDYSDEASYTTPERKYIHMDLILPGYGRTDEKIEEIWAFVDSSGSIGKNQMEQFLTQLYRISKQFKCIFNICYWDTEVTDVYKKVMTEDEILKSIPHHSGGTNINCVYRWIKENRVKPDIMIILTDGYFGSLDRCVFAPSLRKKTILVLSEAGPTNSDMMEIGKITRLD
jgi:predicted metal-dependent peptidase